MYWEWPKVTKDLQLFDSHGTLFFFRMRRDKAVESVQLVVTKPGS